MKPFLIAVVVFFALSHVAEAGDTEKEKVDKVLTGFHDAASKADWDTYFGLMSDDAIFLGTDASERWTKPVFKEYAVKTDGWTYHLTERHITLTPDGNSAWFDELLVNDKYGTSRGTGILIRTEVGWKISQYNLVFPIPNDLAAGITQQIQTFEARQKLGQK